MLDDFSSIKFGTPGHESEYTIHVKGFGHDNYIPRRLESLLQEALPDWMVESRGSRIEIMGRRSNARYGDRDDVEVVPAVEAAFRRYEEHHQELWGENISLGTLSVQPAIAQTLLEHAFDTVMANSRPNLGPDPDLVTQVEELERRNDMSMDLCDDQLSVDVWTLLESVQSLNIRSLLEAGVVTGHVRKEDYLEATRLSSAD